MKKLLTTTLALALMSTVLPSWAGEKGEKTKQCPEEAAVCARMMKEKFKERGWVGINMDYDKERGATVIINVIANSPAERAGFQKGDVLTGLNGVEYTKENHEALDAEYASFKPGKTATFNVKRNGKPVDIVVNLEEIPQAILAQWIGFHILEYHQEEGQVAEVDSEEGDESP